MEKDADKQLELQIDNNQYDESQLIEIRVAINMPYQVNQMEFERHYGEMQIDGQYYTYVKRKIENGFLVLKCIPNHSKQQIKSVGNDFFKMANGLDQDQPGKKQDNNSSIAKNFWSEYDDQNERFDLNPLIDSYNKNFLDYASSLFDIKRSAPEHPPKQSVLI